MIAVITSTINPAKPHDGFTKSYFDVEERLRQTSFTIDSLLLQPFKKIYLIDNSNSFDYSKLSEIYKGKLEILSFKQFQFKNKGINELLMLLAFVDDVAPNEVIFKISGRYYPNKNFLCDINEHHHFKVRGYNFLKKRGSISTRAYFVANKAVFKDFLLKTLNEVFVYPSRKVGLRSAFENLKQFLKPTITAEPSTSIEFAAARVLKEMSCKVQFVEPIGIEGRVAGFSDLATIVE